MNNEMVSLQDVWESAGGDSGVKATKEQTMLVLKQLDACVDTQEEEIQKLEKEVYDLKDMLSRLVKENDLVMPNEKYQWMYSPMRAECLKVVRANPRT